jgi:hypothetical protein
MQRTSELTCHGTVGFIDITVEVKTGCKGHTMKYKFDCKELYIE